MFGAFFHCSSAEDWVFIFPPGWRASPSTWTRHQSALDWRTAETLTALGEYTPTWSSSEPSTSTAVTSLSLRLFLLLKKLTSLLTPSSVSSPVEQAVYNRPKVVDRTKQKEGKDVLEAYQLAQRLQSMVGTHQPLKKTNFKHLNYQFAGPWIDCWLTVCCSGPGSGVCGTYGETGVTLKTWKDRLMRFGDLNTHCDCSAQHVGFTLVYILILCWWCF